MNIITKQEASKNGLTFYYTGKPCKHGHYSQRLVKGGSCKKCKNIYQEKYRTENEEFIKTRHKELRKKYYSSEKRRERYVKHIESELLNAARHRAKVKNLEFNLTKDDIIIPEYCPVLGLKLNLNDKFLTPSLDRIDNSLGYIKGNIKVISNKANRLKNNGTVEDFEKIIKYIKENT
jgi:hypothetical protein